MQLQIAQPGVDSRAVQEVADDLLYLRTAIVNAYLYGMPGEREWVLIDTGLAGFAQQFIDAAARRFGPDVPPHAIVLTHGHFDHVGCVQQLVRRWNVPVFAHAAELPFLTGKTPYPAPEPRVGGGAMAALAWAYPRGPIDLGEHVQPLPEDGSVPGMPGWRWLPTPGHSPGHVSLFRDRDRLLISGDAVITVAQESALAVLRQRTELHGPPMYFTPDWQAAGLSAQRLAELEPEVLAPGHGLPLSGEIMKQQLHHLAVNFESVAVPRAGRYVDRDQLGRHEGSDSPLRPFVAGVLAGAFAATVLHRLGK